MHSDNKLNEGIHLTQNMFFCFLRAVQFLNGSFAKLRERPRP